MRISRSRPRRGQLLVGVTTALVVSLAGCSSTSDDSTGGDADLSASQQECVDAADQFIEDRGLLPESLPEELKPLNKPPTPGLVFTKLFQGNVPTDAESSKMVADLADEIGWVGKTVAWNGTVEDANRKLGDAVDNSDIVLGTGPQPASLKAAIEAARKSNVLIMLTTPEAPESVPGFGANPFPVKVWEDFGADSAHMIAKTSGCRAKVASFGLPDPILQGGEAGLRKTLKEVCEDCEYSYTEIPYADLGSPAATNAVISKLQSDPSIDYVHFMLGDMATGLEPALKQAGLNEVSVGGILPSAPNLAALKNGDNTFWVGVPQETTALLYLDAALRALESGEPYEAETYVAPIFTQDNVTTTDSVPAYPKDIADQFKKLWLVG